MSDFSKGTGIFVEHKDRYFLFADSHATYENKEIYVHYGGDIQNIGRRWINSESNVTPGWDKFDVAILEIVSQFSADLKKDYDFSIDDLDINHSVARRDDFAYLLLGFPSGYTKFGERNDEIHVRPPIYSSKSSLPIKYKNSKVEQINHLLIDFNRRKVFNSEWKRQLGPELKTLKGISGSDIWYLPDLLIPEGDRVPRRIVSVQTEMSRGAVNAFISTRIGVFTEILRRKVSRDLPDALNMNLNL